MVFKSRSGQPSIATSKNPSVVNTILNRHFLINTFGRMLFQHFMRYRFLQFFDIINYSKIFVMISKKKTLKIWIMYQNYNYNCHCTLNLLMQKRKIVNRHLNGFIEKQKSNKCLLNNFINMQSQWRKSLKLILPEKLTPVGIWKISFINQHYFAIFK